MTSIRTIIIDDETHATESLTILLSGVEEIDVIKTISNPLKALDFVVSEKPDLIFLDIKMPELNGIEFAHKLIDMEMLIPCIFVTAHHEFSLDALRQHAIDYLLKPVNPAQLKEAVSRIKRFNQVVFKKNVATLAEYAKNKSLKFNTRNGFKTFPENEVLFIQADGTYSEITLKNGKNIVVSQNIGRIERQLFSDYFIKIHRSVIINKNYIFEVNRAKKCCIVTFEEKEFRLPISSKGLQCFDDALT